MQHFDTDYAERLCERLKSIPEDRQPLWGTLTRRALIEHFVWALRHAMGRSLAVPECGTWFTRTIIKPLILNGLLSIPRNIQLPKQLTSQGIQMREPGDMETLQALLEEYLSRIQDDDLVPYPHPFFGKMEIDEWDRLHVIHFEHHLKQFSA